MYSGPAGVCVSGVGLYREASSGTWVAPPNYQGRWDDAGYEFTEDDGIEVMKPLRELPATGSRSMKCAGLC